MNPDGKLGSFVRVIRDREESGGGGSSPHQIERFGSVNLSITLYGNNLDSATRIVSFMA